VSRGFFQSFVSTQAAGGLVLLAAALAALAIANSPWAETYHALWATRIVVGPEGHVLGLTAQHWVNDGLMTIFFLLVGLEIKRELGVGELSTPRQAALPLAAALGGIVVPAAIYVALAGSGGARGWAIPTATDIAFALGVLSLVAPGAPPGLKVFLAALAIVDDMAAVLVIALFYTSQVAWGAVGAAAVVTLMLVALNRSRVRRLEPYLVLGALLWFFIHESGVHATVAGVITALTVPTRTRINAAQFSAKARASLEAFEREETGDLAVLTSKGQQEALHALESDCEAVAAPLLRLEHGLHAACVFLIMPVFALANAGVGLTLSTIDATTIAVGLGLAIGKPVGITGAAWLACRMRLASLPEGVTWAAVHGCAWIAGIGFTMSLFIAGLAFGDTPRLEAARIGIMIGSLTAAVIGVFVLRPAVRADKRL